MILLHRLQAWNFKQLADVSLMFPREGAILIEGSNEAGKSSLFEAVFFALYGQPLIGDRDYKLEELRTYGAEEMRVELDFSIEDRPFTITRRVGQKQTAKLLCAPGEDGQRESISIVSEIRRRLEEELRLSAAALLNTCFVEQKKLERLEQLNTQARKETINELLNLRVLTALETEFKITRDDEAGLRHLKSRVEIASLDDALPALQEDEQMARRCWFNVQLLDLRTEETSLEREINGAVTRLDEIASRQSQIRAALQAAVALRERLGAFRSNLLLRARRWEEAAETYDRTCHNLTEPQSRAAALTERQRQYELWSGLFSRLKTLERLQQMEEQERTLRNRLDVILAAQQRQERLDAQIAQFVLRMEQCQQEEQDAADAFETANRRIALLEWAVAVEGLAEASPHEGLQNLVPRRESAQALLAAADHQIETSVRQKWIGIALALAGIATGGAIFLTHYSLLLIPALLLLAGAALTTYRSAKSGKVALVQKEAARNELAGLEGERRAVERRAEIGTAAGDRLRLREEEARSALQRLRVVVPCNSSEARSAAEELLALPVDDARMVHQRAQNTLQAVSTELQLLRQRRAEESLEPTPEPSGLKKELETLHCSRLELCDSLEHPSGGSHGTLLDKQGIMALLERDQLPVTTGELQARLASLRALLDHDEEEAQKLPPLLQEREKRAAGLEEQAAEFKAEWTKILPGIVPPVGPAEALARLPSLESQTADDLAGLNEPALREENDQLEAESRLLQARMAAWAGRASEIEKQQQALLSALPLPALTDRATDYRASSPESGVEGWGGGRMGGNAKHLPYFSQPPTPNPSPWQGEGSQAALPQPQPPLPKTGEGEFPSILPSTLPPIHPSIPLFPNAVEWEAIVREREESIRKNRSDRQAAAALLDVAEELLSLPEATAAHAAEEKRLEVRRRAGIAVAKTRQSIVSRVMPLTLQNMRQLLPLLTEGRYADAEWDEAANMLSVYDRRAGLFQRKRVFSGGARDQISLALRLAFALATLPGEHNVRPGWLFLDEPLSSFDRQRTAALVDLITHGLIRREFAQIFLVSHSESFDPARFDYRLRIEGGAVVESTLPPSP